VCVSGYPEAHPDSISDDPAQTAKAYWADIDYLKQKIEAGGEFVITQLFYDVDIYLQYVKDCR
jgi:methylenetetrahydrofolate reductase (NADPH)